MLLAQLLIHAALQAQAIPSAPLDTMIDVGGYRLHVVVHRGTAPVAVVLETGGGANLGAWDGVDARIAAETGATVIAYERAGFGASELGPLDLLPPRQVDDLVRALDALDAPARRIVVGHSYGALLALDHAHRHPEGVIGVVLVDPMNPAFVAMTGDFVYGTVPHIQSPANDIERAIKRLVDTFEHPRAAAEIAVERVSVPMVVISAGVPFWGEAAARVAWSESHARMVAGWPQRRLVIADGSGHQVPRDRPDTIVDAVRSLMDD